jgi:hypothetical protein
MALNSPKKEPNKLFDNFAYLKVKEVPVHVSKSPEGSRKISSLI